MEGKPVMSEYSVCSLILKSFNFLMDCLLVGLVQVQLNKHFKSIAISLIERLDGPHCEKQNLYTQKMTT